MVFMVFVIVFVGIVFVFAFVFFKTKLPLSHYLVPLGIVFNVDNDVFAIFALLDSHDNGFVVFGILS